MFGRRPLDLSMLREERDGHAPWHELDSADKIEQLHDRLRSFEKARRVFIKASWLAFTTGIGVLVREVVKGYRITTVPPAPLSPWPNETTAVDRKAPPPKTEP